MCKKGIYPFLLHLLLIFIQPYSPHHYRLVDIHQIIENCSGMILNSSKLSEIKMSHTYDCLDRQDRHSRWPRSKSRLVRLGKVCTLHSACDLFSSGCSSHQMIFHIDNTDHWDLPIKRSPYERFARRSSCSKFGTIWRHLFVINNFSVIKYLVK